MKYALRFVWHIARLVIIAVSAFALLVVAFFTAMDSANVFVIVTDGMKAKAQTVLMQNSDADLTKYFSNAYLGQNQNMDDPKYQDYIIKDIDYKISVESLWCQPWNNTATVTVVESIPSMNYDLAEESQDKEISDVPAPQWPRARYKIVCERLSDSWRIISVDKMKALLPEPTPTPEPSDYITASPVPTATPSASVSAQTTATPSPSPSATKKK